MVIHLLLVENDIALVFLREDVILGPAARPACISDAVEPQVGEPVIALGWGLTSVDGSQSESLQEVTVRVTDPSVCREKYRYFNLDISETMICAADKDKDTCQGDSGGPLLQADASGRIHAVGIVSFGIGCANPFFPGVYTNVAKFAGWIEQQCALCSL